MHAQGVMHRDLKPENVLIRFGRGARKERQAGMEVKIADFGLARDPPTVSSPLTSYISTRWYRAPELVIRMKNYNQAVDIFALGCIMA